MKVYVLGRPDPLNFPKADSYSLSDDGRLTLWAQDHTGNQDHRRVAIFASGGWLGFEFGSGLEQDITREIGFRTAAQNAPHAKP